mmetsp:Transcript_75271/g.233689  ORF Transcript_75271/g.233689 Transcript_75271/m.233689 type:complete len:622 (-) Transcript_75271:42-1907(-)
MAAVPASAGGPIDVAAQPAAQQQSWSHLFGETATDNEPAEKKLRVYDENMANKISQLHDAISRQTAGLEAVARAATTAATAAANAVHLLQVTLAGNQGPGLQTMPAHDARGASGAHDGPGRPATAAGGTVAAAAAPAAPAAPASATPTPIAAQPNAAQFDAASISVTMPFEVEPLKELPEKYVKHIGKVASNHENNINKYHKASSRLEKSREDLDVLRDASTGYRYPPGIRPFRSPTDNIELDEAWSATRNSDVTVSVVIEKGSSRRDAMAKLHHAHVVRNRAISLEGLEARVNALRPLITRSAYYEAIDDMNDDPSENFDLDEPVRPAIDRRLIYEKAEQMYARIVDKTRTRKQKEIDDREKERKKKEAEEMELANAKPSTLLADLVGSVIEERLAQRNSQSPNAAEKDMDVEPDVRGADHGASSGVDDDGGDNDNTTASAKAVRFCEAVQSTTYCTNSKNGLSPGAGLGKGKGNGKGKHGKSKGKGRDQGRWSNQPGSPSPKTAERTRRAKARAKDDSNNDSRSARPDSAATVPAPAACAAVQADSGFTTISTSQAAGPRARSADGHGSSISSGSSVVVGITIKAVLSAAIQAQGTHGAVEAPAAPAADGDAAALRFAP